MNRVAAGIGNTQQPSFIAASGRVNAVQQSDVTRQRITSVKTQTIYVMQSASRDYVRNIRSARAEGSYRDDPVQNRYQIWSGEYHISYQDAVTRGISLKNGNAGESFVQEHLNRLNETRERYAERERSGSYERMETDRSDAAQRDEPETVRVKKAGDNRADQESDAVSARRVGRSETEFPGNTPDTSFINFVGSHMVR